MEVRDGKSCRTCCYAYLNEHDPKVSITEHEGCSMGMIPLQARLPENWACHLYQQRAPGFPRSRKSKMGPMRG